MIAWLVARIGLPAWLIEFLAAVIVASIAAIGVHVWEHRLIKQGVAEQQQRDAQALKDLKDQALLVTQQLQQRAEAAEEAYAKERADSLSYQAVHPITTAHQLCHDTHGGRPDLPKVSPSHPGNETITTTSGVGGQVHATDSPGSQDRLRLLGAFAALLDRQDAVIREFQQRTQP